MARALGNDLAEIFGYAADDNSTAARRQWKSQECPFVGGTCVKHSHPQAGGRVVVYGSCSVANKTRGGLEEVIICPQRLYAGNHETLKACIRDAISHTPPMYLADEYSALKRAGKVPSELVLLIGHGSGREVSVSNPGIIDLSIDWVMVWMKSGKPLLAIPCEVQSIDITGNYQANWDAYAKEKSAIPNSNHGMNWANVWKRLIPQLMLKASIAATSTLCKQGLYFVVPERVYYQFEKIVGKVRSASGPGHGVMTIMTYELGPNVPQGQIRKLIGRRVVRMLSTDFATAFASGQQLPLGTQLDTKVMAIIASL